MPRYPKVVSALRPCSFSFTITLSDAAFAIKEATAVSRAAPSLPAKRILSIKLEIVIVGNFALNHATRASVKVRAINGLKVEPVGIVRKVTPSVSINCQ